jgi:hypothetical protein
VLEKADVIVGMSGRNGVGHCDQQQRPGPLFNYGCATGHFGRSFGLAASVVGDTAFGM